MTQPNAVPHFIPGANINGAVRFKIGKYTNVNNKYPGTIGNTSLSLSYGKA